MKFSQNYREARQTFLQLAKIHNFAISSYQLHGFHGPDQEDLFTDVAYWLPENTQNVFIILSGTHGVEGYYGSAMQTHWLENLGEVPEGVGLILIHAINPYGFAYQRRVNEANMDVNRNFINFEKPLPKNEFYPDFEKTFAPKHLDNPLVNAITFLQLLGRYVKDIAPSLTCCATDNTAHKAKFAHFFIPFIAGQYSHPQGFSFGGHTPSWSNLTLHSILSTFISPRKSINEIAFIDLHSGIGAPGKLQAYSEIVGEESSLNRENSARVRTWLEGAAKPMPTPYPCSGAIFSMVAKMFPEKVVTSFAIECGTLSPLKVVSALRKEYWLHQHHHEDDPKFSSIKRNFLQAFFPKEQKWQTKALASTMRVFDTVVKRLSETVVSKPALTI